MIFSRQDELDGFKMVFATMVIIALTFVSCDDKGTDPFRETGSVTDVEGNIYRSIKIGNQWWMTENLRSASFNSGEKIASVELKENWASMEIPAFCSYNNLNSSTGLLYNYHVVTSDKNIAPEGWRVPTDDDWKELEEFLGMSVQDLDQTNWRGSYEGDQLKEITTNTTGWVYHEDVWGIDDVGFEAVGGSCRVFNGEWDIPGLRHSGYWWTSTSSEGYGWFRGLDYQQSGIFRYAAHPNYGFSIRCIKE